MKFEKVKSFGEMWERETFESLVERKATEIEFAFNGFIKIYEQPDRLSPEDQMYDNNVQLISDSRN